MNLNSTDSIFSGLDNFHSRRNLEKLIRKCVGEDVWRSNTKILKWTAKYAERAYYVGVNEAMLGHPKPTLDGLEKLIEGKAAPKVLEACYSFIGEMAGDGWELGQVKKELR